MRWPKELRYLPQTRITTNFALGRSALHPPQTVCWRGPTSDAPYVEWRHTDRSKVPEKLQCQERPSQNGYEGERRQDLSPGGSRQKTRTAKSFVKRITGQALYLIGNDVREPGSNGESHPMVNSIVLDLRER